MYSSFGIWRFVKAEKRRKLRGLNAWGVSQQRLNHGCIVICFAKGVWPRLRSLDSGFKVSWGLAGFLSPRVGDGGCVGAQRCVRGSKSTSTP